MMKAYLLLLVEEIDTYLDNDTSADLRNKGSRQPSILQAFDAATTPIQAELSNKSKLHAHNLRQRNATHQGRSS